MSTHSIAEASNSLSRLVAKAEAGEAVVITRHGREVARIVAAHARRKPPMSPDEIADLLAFNRSLGPPPSEDAGSYVSRMRDEDCV